MLVVCIQIQGGITWTGRMDAVPRIGERISVDGCLLRVLDVEWTMGALFSPTPGHGEGIVGLNSVRLSCDIDTLSFPKSLLQKFEFKEPR
jgi:hypothetical protein